jgi:hypothetical protein
MHYARHYEIGATPDFITENILRSVAMLQLENSLPT